MVDRSSQWRLTRSGSLAQAHGDFPRAIEKSLGRGANSARRRVRVSSALRERAGRRLFPSSRGPSGLRPGLAVDDDCWGSEGPGSQLRPACQRLQNSRAGRPNRASPGTGPVSFCAGIRAISPGSSASGVGGSPGATLSQRSYAEIGEELCVPTTAEMSDCQAVLGWKLLEWRKCEPVEPRPLSFPRFAEALN